MAYKLAQSLRLTRTSQSALSQVSWVWHGNQQSSQSLINFYVLSVNKPTAQKINVTAMVLPRVTCDLPLHLIHLDQRYGNTCLTLNWIWTTYRKIDVLSPLSTMSLTPEERRVLMWAECIEPSGIRLSCPLSMKCIPRCYFSMQLHGFSDASEDAYVRVSDCHGNVRVSIVTSKTKVAPLKRLTLELCFLLSFYSSSSVMQ